MASCVSGNDKFQITFYDSLKVWSVREAFKIKTTKHMENSISKGGGPDQIPKFVTCEIRT